jgi:probable F420-dependent oxidoreductase
LKEKNVKLDRRIGAELLRDVPKDAIALRSEGYDGLWTAETKHDPFFPLILAAEHTDAEIGTAIAVAFARNPMIIAQLGWDVQAFSEGRFILGLGSQVKPHITRRFSMEWSKPLARMEEFVLAVRAIWSAWENGTRLKFEGEFYTHNLMSPYFDPGANPYGNPKIMLAAVGAKMAEVSGRVSDGLVGHVFQTPKYIHEVLLPAVERGLAAAGKQRSDFQMKLPVFVVTGRDDAERAVAVDSMRKEISFYASTPAYRPVLECHGLGDLQEELANLSRAGEWDAMAGKITDEILETFAVIADPLDVIATVRKRYGDVIDRLGFHIPYDTNNELGPLIAAGRLAE